MATRLWDFYDGEPFMQNPRLGILGLMNPKRKSKKGRKKMARRKRQQPAGLRRYWAKHRHKGRKSTPRRSHRRRRARKNWISPGVVVAANPRRKHHRRRRHHMNARRRRHHYSRNPRLLGFELPAVKTVLFAGVGFAGPSFIQGFVTQLAPSLMQQATSMGLLGKYAVKVGSILTLSWLTRRFVGHSESQAVMVGGGINVAMSLVNDFAPGFLPANPLSMYVATRPGLQAYVPTRPGLRAIPGAGRAIGTTAIPTAAPFRKLNTSGPFGTALRFQRY